jgi:hypothetical protein
MERLRYHHEVRGASMYEIRDREGSCDMGALRLAGVLWIIAGLSSALLLVFVLDNPLYTAIMGGGAVVGLVIGGLLIARPSVGVVGWSNIAGLVWLIAFGGLTVVNLDKPIGQVFGVVWLTVFGVGGALAAYLRRGAAGGLLR